MTLRTCLIPPALLLACALCAQGSDQPQPAPAQAAQAPSQVLRAQYKWGYAGGDGQGKGTLSVLVEPATGQTILELHGLGERLMLLKGDRETGYQVQIPRRKLDEKAATLAEVPLPFFPQIGSPEALYQLLTEGSGPGVKVTRKDALGPVKLSYTGKDDKGKEVMVWLERTLWQPGS